jgi:Do/DeqQ family serine protease
MPLTPAPQSALQTAPPSPASPNGLPQWGVVSYADAVQNTAPAIVNIHTQKVVAERNPFANDPIARWLFGGTPNSSTRQRIERSLGSGVIFTPQGYVLTNHHVIRDADEIIVILADGRESLATVVGTDAATDLAVLKIPMNNLPSITLGDPARLRVGDVVLAIGNPFGVGQTVTQGIVSAIGRSQLGISTYENFIQTDAAINPGNSGGALIDALGRLVGINTAIFSQSGGSVGIGFAIPVDLAQQVMQSIIEHGYVVRGWIGIEAQEISPLLAESFGLPHTQGVLIAGILRGGPADEAGMRPGDVITHIDQTPVTATRDLMTLIAGATPGHRLEIEGYRAGERFEATVNVIQRPETVMQ